MKHAWRVLALALGLAVGLLLTAAAGTHAQPHYYVVETP